MIGAGQNKVDWKNMPAEQLLPRALCGEPYGQGQEGDTCQQKVVSDVTSARATLTTDKERERFDIMARNLLMSRQNTCLKSISSRNPVDFNTLKYRDGKSAAKDLGKCLADGSVSDVNAQMGGVEMLQSQQWARAAGIARGDIAPPRPSDVDLPKNLKDYLYGNGDNSLPKRMANDPDLPLFQKKGEALYRGGVGLLYPYSEMINAMDPVGQDVINEMNKFVDSYIDPAADKAAKDKVEKDLRNTFPVSIKGPPYDVDFQAFPDSITDFKKGPLIRAELMRLAREGLNKANEQGTPLSNLEKLADALNAEVAKLGDANAQAEKLPGLGVTGVTVDEAGNVTAIALGPRETDGGQVLDVPTFLIEAVDAQNDMSKQLALQWLFHQSLNFLKAKGFTPSVNDRQAIAGILAQKVKDLNPYAIATLVVMDMPQGDVVLAPAPGSLYSFIGPRAADDFMRNGHRFDVDSLGLITTHTDLFIGGFSRSDKPSTLSGEQLAYDLGLQLNDMYMLGKNIPDSVLKTENPARARGLYVRTLEVSGFDANGRAKLTPRTDLGIGGGAGDAKGPLDWDFHGFQIPCKAGDTKCVQDGTDEGFHSNVSVMIGGMGSPYVDKAADAEDPKDGSSDRLLVDVTVEFNWLQKIDNTRFYTDIRGGVNTGRTPDYFDAVDNVIDLTNGDHGGGWQAKMFRLSLAGGFELGADRQHKLELEGGLSDLRIKNAASAGFAPYNNVNAGIRNYLGEAAPLGLRLTWDYAGEKAWEKNNAYAPAFEFSRPDRGTGTNRKFNSHLSVIGGFAKGAIAEEVSGLGGGRFGFDAGIGLNMSNLLHIDPIDWRWNIAGGWQMTRGKDEHGASVRGNAWDISTAMTFSFLKHLQMAASFGGGQTDYDPNNLDGPQTRMRAGLTIAFPIEDAFWGTKLVPSIHAAWGRVSAPKDLQKNDNDPTTGCQVNGQPDSDCDNIADGDDVCPDDPGMPAEEDDTWDNGCCPIPGTCQASNNQVATGESGGVNDRGMPDAIFGYDSIFYGGGLDWYLNSNISTGIAGGGETVIMRGDESARTNGWNVQWRLNINF